MVLLGLTLPGLDGWQIGRQIKANFATAQVIVLALTAHTLPGDRKCALDAGCGGYISKTLDVFSFTRQISSYMQDNPPPHS